MLYRTRGGFGQSLELPDDCIRIELYDKTTGMLVGALPQVTSIAYDDTNHLWVVVNNYDTSNPWQFSCNLYNMYIYPPEQSIHP